MFRLAWLALIFLGLPPAYAQNTDVALANWAEAEFGSAVKQRAAVAATVSVVRGNRTVYSATFGAADALQNTTILPTQNRFLVASVTKTFTATAIAQLIERGLIRSVDDPANLYLKRVKLPRFHGRDVTIRHLLTHSAGFEERGFGIGRHTKDPAPLPSDAAEARIPRIVRAPGNRVVYANIDPPILGMIVEDLTGLTFQEYLRRSVLKPLGMADTELMYDPTAPRLVQPYLLGAKGQTKKIPLEINTPFYAPTGSIHTTAKDMALFMQAQLGLRPSVLPESLVQRLHQPLARNADGLDAIAMLFFAGERNGTRIVSHAGAFSGFQSDMILIPERQLGVFFSWAGSPAPDNPSPPLDLARLREGFLEIAIGPSAHVSPRQDDNDVSRHAGRYWMQRRPHSTPEVLLAMHDVLDVTADKNRRALFISGDGPYFEIGPRLFARASINGLPEKRFAFTQHEILAASNFGKRVFGLSDPVLVYQLGKVGVFSLTTGVFAFILWRPSRYRFVGMLASILGIGILLAYKGFGGQGGFMAEIIAGDAWRIQALRFLACACIALVPVLFFVLYASWKGANRPKRWVERTHSALLMAGAALLLPAIVMTKLL